MLTLICRRQCCCTRGTSAAAAAATVLSASRSFSFKLLRPVPKPPPPRPVASLRIPIRLVRRTATSSISAQSILPLSSSPAAAVAAAPGAVDSLTGPPNPTHTPLNVETFTTSATTSPAPPLTPASPSPPPLSSQSNSSNSSNADDGISDLRWRPAPDYTPSAYLELSKAKLSAFVVLTAMAGYAVAPGALSVSTLLWTTVGTALCSGAANAINQWVEHPYDAQMSRTRNRVLVRHGLSPLHAFGAGVIGGATGVGILAHFVNPLTAFLGATNLILYTCVYTPMKRTSIANTWVGAVVGALPPMMGWAAATGTMDLGGCVMGAILYAWQFPHFNSLAWNLRPDYSKAGYRMMSVTNPALNGRVSLRHSIALFPLAWCLPYIGMTTPWFALDSTIINAYMAVKAYKFWKHPSDKTARTLFFGSLVHLPVLLMLLMIHKNHRGEEDPEGGGVSDAIAKFREWVSM
ncbi:hypothetical protein PhCBS80983_g00203 [Powellomyces hirtus]|uniref:Protoheme IX farnesyltransferase, mitochondrial n=1 Tax=Powellomyces hirtus TaxID=109895 RepID=A0A507EGN6_9FUNG|nr:hypothetical protein PhCBS80983_g00203 [Powellomyces hirtus]